MNDLSHVGLKVRSVNGLPEGQTRLEVRTTDGEKGTDTKFVALFHSTVRMSNGEPVVNLSAEIVHRQEVSSSMVRRRELTAEQVEAIQEWLKELTFVALTKDVL